MAKLYFRYSAMNAGKSTALIQVAYNYKEQGHNVLLLTAEIDTRSGVGKIASRLGVDTEAQTYNAKTNLGAYLTASLKIKDQPEHKMKSVMDISCVLVDEAQFLTPKQVKDLHRFAHVCNIPVICYGLRSDFQGEPFPGSVYLLSLADSLEELKNICECGRKATMNVRVDKHGKRITQGKQIAIEGEKHIYKQQCGNCFYSTR